MSTMAEEWGQLTQLLTRAQQLGVGFLQSLEERPVAVTRLPPLAAEALPESGGGSAAALAKFAEQIMPHLSASAGPRYWGFVTGGATPAALVGDWLAAATDQNLSSAGDSIAPSVEVQVLGWLRELFHLPSSFDGSLTSGATSANLLGLLCGRQHAGQRQGVDVAASGLGAVRIEVFAACPHASSLKSLAMAGLGRDNVVAVARLSDGECMDVADLAQRLAASDSPGKIVLASAGTVTGTDFDDLEATAELCRQHGAWLHVDAAFGLFARLLDDRRLWTRGIERADSITSDSHKWLNVPYDSGIFLTRHIDLLEQVLTVASPYLPGGGDLPHFMQRGVENSRRFRALPLWFSLRAYGRRGFAQLVAENCRQAAALAQWLDASPHYRLLVPAKLNVVVFCPAYCVDLDAWLARLNDSGEVFMTPGRWAGEDTVRAAFSNWRTGAGDVTRVTALLTEMAVTETGGAPA